MHCGLFSKFNGINTAKLTQVGKVLKIIVIRAPTMIILKSLRVFEIQDTLFQRLWLITILRALPLHEKLGKKLG